MAEHEKQAVNTAPADVEVGSAEDVEAVMKKYDRESNVRIWTGFPARLVRYGMALFMLTMIWVSMFSTAEGSVRRCFFLGIVLAFVFIMYPIKKNMKLKPNHIPIYDVVLLVVAVGVYFYQIIFKEELIAMGRRIGTPQIIIGIIAILVLVEACRRVVGIPIIIVAAAFVAYTLLPMGADKPLQGTIYNLVYTTNGIIGTPIQVCSTYIFLFVLFGSFLEATGIAAFFIDCANSIAGAATGGQIMPPIMGAAAFLMAEMTDTEYADILVRAILPAALYFTGIFLMVHFKAKSIGLKGLDKDSLPKGKDIFPKLYLLLPLIVLVFMVIQSGTFTMAYSAVVACLVAIVAGMADRETGSKKFVMMVPAIPLLVYALGKVYLPDVIPAFADSLEMQETFTLVCFGIFFVLVVACHLISKPNMQNVGTYINALESGTKSTLSVGVACGMAGIIAGVVTYTGLGQILINAIVGIAGGHLIIALVLTMVCCVILGMGVPTTANYIIMATTCAPILIQMGLPVLAAHFFVFYFGIVADITPPVALAAYAGSAIAKAPPMKTALNATRLAIAAFIIPYIFAYSPIMLFIGDDVNAINVIRVVITSFGGMFLIAAGLIGFMLQKLNIVLRLVSVAAGLMMIHPGALTDVIGIAILIAILAYQVISEKRHAATA